MIISYLLPIFTGVNLVENCCARLVPIVVKVMGDVFPELKHHETRIREIIADEETSFGRTLLKVSFFPEKCSMWNFLLC